MQRDDFANQESKFALLCPKKASKRCQMSRALSQHRQRRTYLRIMMLIRLIPVRSSGLASFWILPLYVGLKAFHGM